MSLNALLLCSCNCAESLLYYLLWHSWKVPGNRVCTNKCTTAPRHRLDSRRDSPRCLRTGHCLILLLMRAEHAPLVLLCLLVWFLPGLRVRLAAAPAASTTSSKSRTTFRNRVQQRFVRRVRWRAKKKRGEKTNMSANRRKSFGFFIRFLAFSTFAKH